MPPWLIHLDPQLNSFILNLMRKIAWLIILIPLTLSACSLINRSDEPLVEVTQAVVVATPLPSPTSPATPQINEPTSAGPTVLNVWLVGEFNSQADLPGSVILAEQLATFQANRPDLEIHVSVKSVSGPGGALSYLRTGRNVAPSVMPDLIILSDDQLETAVAEELIYPLDNLVSDAFLADLYPGASSVSRVGDLAYAYPFVLENLSHMAYSSAVYTGTLPITWDDLLEDEAATFTFPGAGLPGAEFALQLYLANGGSLTNESGQPMLDLDPLASALTLLLEGRERGVLPIQTTNLTLLEEAWQLFDNEVVNSVQTTYALYIAQRENSLESGYMGLPGPEAPLAPIIKAWSWAISTPDSSRQILTADLLNWLIAAPNMGDYSLAANKLPTRRTAFEQWPEGDPYLVFIQRELEVADPYPSEASGPILNAIGLAVFDVLSLAKTPQQAAQDAISSLSL